MRRYILQLVADRYPRARTPGQGRAIVFAFEGLLYWRRWMCIGPGMECGWELGRDNLYCVQLDISMHGYCPAHHRLLP